MSFKCYLSWAYSLRMLLLSCLGECKRFGIAVWKHSRFLRERRYWEDYKLLQRCQTSLTVELSKSSYQYRRTGEVELFINFAYLMTQNFVWQNLQIIFCLSSLHLVYFKKAPPGQNQSILFNFWPWFQQKGGSQFIKGGLIRFLLHYTQLCTLISKKKFACGKHFRFDHIFISFLWIL